MQEYEIAKEKKCVIIPIGCTGNAAASIFADVIANKNQYPYLEKYLDILSTESDIDQIVSAVIEIIKSQRIIK